MIHKRILYSIVLFSLSLASHCQPGTMNGQIKLDTTIWSPIAYLSLISDFEEMYSMSNEIIIDKARIDYSGKFHFKFNYFPPGDHLIRIHISKKNDPVASLIIGGKDENHIFLIANNFSSINLVDSSNTDLFINPILSGYQPNNQLQQIDRIANYFDTTITAGYPIKMELIRNAISEKLRNFADTCSNPIVALYAIYKSRFEKNYSVNQQFYKNFLSKWKNERSSYFVVFRKRIPKNSDFSFYYLMTSSIVFFFIGLISSYFYLKTLRRKNILIKDLSVQERRIYKLLIEGKTNKEISDILTIGLSTVKSHINSIYSKLNISSRKEILNLTLDNEVNNL